MADMITRCPKCGTAFRISDALLKSAKGVVRCGSCLSVFNAKEHLENKPAPARETPPPARTIPPEPEPPVTPDAPEDPPEQINPWRMRRAEESLFERPQSKIQEEQDDEDDEAWALELLKDDSDLNVRFKKISNKPVPPPNPEPPAPEHTPYEADPESVAPLAIVTEEKDAPATEPESEPEPEQEEPASEPLTGVVSDGAAAPSSTAAISATSVGATKRKPIRPKFEPKSVPLEQVIAALEPEPLELDWQQPGSWKKRLLWPVLVLLALVCLVGQVAWLEFHRLNRLEPYRSMYGVACEVLGCTLPELRDLTQIQTSNLVVRANPELDGVLLVDVILQNNAAFEQTFPNIQLTFTNMSNTPVATRTLRPTDYLGGEMAGRDKMPVRQPIHIGLEIADPGRDAVSYHISIVE